LQTLRLARLATIEIGRLQYEIFSGLAEKESIAG
jgi:hypothetical protein